MTIITFAQIAAPIIFAVLGVFFFGWLKILKETNALLRAQNEELKADNKEWQQKHIENEKAISNLQGQIDIIKNIPLQSIDQTLKDIKANLLESSLTLTQDTASAARAVKKVKTDLRNSK